DRSHHFLLDDRTVRVPGQAPRAEGQLRYVDSRLSERSRAHGEHFYTTFAHAPCGFQSRATSGENRRRADSRSAAPESKRWGQGGAMATNGVEDAPATDAVADAPAGDRRTSRIETKSALELVAMRGRDVIGVRHLMEGGRALLGSGPEAIARMSTKELGGAPI